MDHREGRPLTSFRLAHLSDPHLPWALPKGRELAGKRLLSRLNWHRKRSRLHRPEFAEILLQHMLAEGPDAIALTGDVVNFALPREFRAARPWIERLGPPENVLIVPGNHEAMAGDWTARMQAAWEQYAPRLPRMTRQGPLALIQVSTACVTPPFFASGRIDDPDHTAALIDEAEAADLLPVVLMHHPPTALTSSRKGLLGMEAAQKAMARAALVLHGHTHRADFSRFAGAYGDVPVLGIPSFSMTPADGHLPAGAWRQLSFAGNRVTITEYAITSDKTVAPRTPIRLTLPCRRSGDGPR